VPIFGDRSQIVSGVYKKLECGDTQARAHAELSPRDVVFGEDCAHSAQSLPLSISQFGCGAQWIRNQTEKERYVNPVSFRVFSARNAGGSCFGKDCGD
jgi:hypothetical protein